MSQDIKERLRNSPLWNTSPLHEEAADRIEALERQLADLRQAEHQAPEWISVEGRLPDQGLLVLVYSPPQPGDWPDSIRIEFDFICPDYECWHNHSEHYEHFCCVAKGGADVEFTGPSERAPYTHWMLLPAAPSAGQAKPDDGSKR